MRYQEKYVELVNAQINQQIKERQGIEGEVFFTQEEGGFETISEEQNFYINSAGNVVIVFEKYEIAPGFMGNVEFEIIVFWNSTILNKVYFGSSLSWRIISYLFIFRRYRHTGRTT